MGRSPRLSRLGIAAGPHLGSSLKTGAKERQTKERHGKKSFRQQRTKGCFYFLHV